MYAIAAMYAAAGISYAIQGKPMWFAICFCWGVGNALLAILSTK